MNQTRREAKKHSGRPRIFGDVSDRDSTYQSTGTFLNALGTGALRSCDAGTGGKSLGVSLWNQASARKNGKEQGDQKGPVKMYFKSKDFDDALLWEIINIGGSKLRRPETLILSHPKPMALGHYLVN